MRGSLSKWQFKLSKSQFLPNYWSDKGFYGSVLSRALSLLCGESLEIKLADLKGVEMAEPITLKFCGSTHNLRESFGQPWKINKYFKF